MNKLKMITNENLKLLQQLYGSVRLIPLQINSSKNQQRAGQINQQNMILEKSRNK